MTHTEAPSGQLSRLRAEHRAKIREIVAIKIDTFIDHSNPRLQERIAVKRQLREQATALYEQIVALEHQGVRSDD